MNSCTKEPKVVAIIPARGGSKGIPRKNIRDLCGKPLVAYSIEVALKAKKIDRVIVSTDDEEIAEISKSFGAEVPFLRPKEISGGRALVGMAIDYTIKKLYGKSCDDLGIVTLYPTHPFRTPALVDKLIQKLEHGCNFITTARSIEVSPIHLLRKDESTKDLSPILDFPLDRQENVTRKYYRPYGLLTINRLGKKENPYIHIIRDKISLIDIDEEEDFLLAREVIKNNLFDFGVD